MKIIDVNVKKEGQEWAIMEVNGIEIKFDLYPTDKTGVWGIFKKEYYDTFINLMNGKVLNINEL